MCVSVKSAAKGQRLGEAARLVVRIHDAAKRPSVARRVARKLDVLLRGMGAAVDGGVGPEVEFLTVPACPVVSPVVHPEPRPAVRVGLGTFCGGPVRLL